MSRAGATHDAPARAADPDHVRGVRHPTGHAGVPRAPIVRAWESRGTCAAIRGFRASRPRAPRDHEIAEHRRRAIDHDPTLRARGRQHYERIQAEFARAASERLGAAPTDLRPQIFAGAAMAFLWTMETAAREDADGTHALLEDGFAALRATFDALAAGTGPR